MSLGIKIKLIKVEINYVVLKYVVFDISFCFCKNIDNSFIILNIYFWR